MNNPFDPVASLLSILPNIGYKSALRIVSVLAQEKNLNEKLIKGLTKLSENCKECSICNNISFSNICNICSSLERDQNQICVVGNINNLWAIENTKLYNGTFHVIKEKNIMEYKEYIEKEIEKRINHESQEFIIAMNPTIEGQAIVHYIQKTLKQYENVTVSTLSLGLPIGSSLDYLDSGTLSIALESRREL